MLKRFYYNIINLIVHDWKMIIYSLILSMIGFLVFILILHKITN